MHTDHIKGNWKQFKGNVKQLWGEITFAPLDVAEGISESQSGQIQASKGIAMENARKQRIARVQSGTEFGRINDTPEIELYHSPRLKAYTGSIGDILLNLRDEGSRQAQLLNGIPVGNLLEIYLLKQSGERTGTGVTNEKITSDDISGAHMQQCDS